MFQMRLYGRDELELIDELGPDPPDAVNAEGSVQPSTRFLARVCATGRDVTIRRYSRPDPSFKDAVSMAKKIW